jgi:hypothetical protein
MDMKKLLLVIALAIIAAACGNRPPEETPAGVPEPAWAASAEHRTIAVVDSIGVELGDSNYVFGQIAGAVFTPSGDIAVLDMKKAQVLLYGSDGTYIASVGRNGSGPGEFLMPSSFSFTPGGELIVADAMSRKLSLFDATMAYTGCLEGFFPTAPVVILAMDSASVVGMKPEFQQDGEEMNVGFSLSRWDGSIEPSVVYFSEMAPFNPQDLGSAFGENMFSFTASPSTGRVFRSPMTSEHYIVEGFEADGTSFLTIEQEYTPVAKTPEEIQEEIEMVETRMTESGAPPELANWEPDPNKAAVAGLFLDGEQRLWVRRGWTDEAVFDVYDMSGALLFVAAVDYDPEQTDDWQVTMDGGGMLAFSANPPDYPKLYVLEMQ